jgi:hypothetical protein
MAKCSINGSHCSSAYAYVVYVQFGYGTVLHSQLFILMRIRFRIQVAKLMQIQQDPDSDPGQTFKLQKDEFLHENTVGILEVGKRSKTYLHTKVQKPF